MKTPTRGILNGAIGLSMLVMFTVAIVAGQARANLDAEERSALVVTESNRHASLSIRLHDVKRLEALPALVKTVLDAPLDVDIIIQAGQITAFPESPLAGHE